MSILKLFYFNFKFGIIFFFLYKKLKFYKNNVTIEKKMCLFFVFFLSIIYYTRIVCTKIVEFTVSKAVCAYYKQETLHVTRENTPWKQTRQTFFFLYIYRI
jgi:archaellum biogenesis protein FlaJ (TadC family)